MVLKLTTGTQTSFVANMLHIISIAKMLHNSTGQEVQLLQRMLYVTRNPLNHCTSVRKKVTFQKAFSRQMTFEGH